MRAVVASGGLPHFVSQEEHDLISKIDKIGTTERAELTERENELANILVSKGILTYVPRKNQSQCLKFLGEVD